MCLWLRDITLSSNAMITISAVDSADGCSTNFFYKIYDCYSRVNEP